MFLSLNFLAFSGILIAASSLFMAALMFSLGRSALNYVWGLLCVAVFIWGGSFYVIAQTTSPTTALLWWKISHIGVIFIPVFFMHFLYIFLDKKEPHNRVEIVLLYACGLFFLCADLNTNWFINHVQFVFNQLYYNSPPGALYPLFFVFFQALIIYGHVLLFQTYWRSSDQQQRQQIRYFFIATVVGFLGGGFSFLVVFGLNVYPSSIITVALYPIIMGYAILKFRLFNLRLVTAQIIALLIFTFTFIKLFLSKTFEDYVLNGILLLIAAALGTYLVRSVMKEVMERELIEQKEKEIEEANARIVEVDKQKDQFVSMASHQLRTPVTVIRWYASMLLNGSYGLLPADAQKALHGIFNSSSVLTSTINDYLNVSRIEQEKLQYHFAEVDVVDILKTAAAEHEPIAKQKGLTFETHIQDQKVTMNGDADKLAQVFSNLLDNAIAYTPKGGTISVSFALVPEGNKVRIEIRDNGIGISKDMLEKIFDKYARTQMAMRLNTSGTGLGLFIARTFVLAHKGSVWPESSGEGKGSTFIVELPLSPAGATGTV